MQDRVALSVVDIRNRQQVREACQRIQPEIVYHLAAYGVHAEQQDVPSAVETNVTGTANVLEGLRGTVCGLLVATGTWAEYGDKDHPIVETEALEPVGVYGATKAASSLIALAFAAQWKVPVIVLRPFSVYGPGEGGNKFVPSVIRACLGGINPRLTSCKQIRDYLYVGDVVEAYVAAAALAASPVSMAVNVASGVPLRLEDFANAIVGQFPGITAEFGALPDRDREIKKVQADIARARAVLGWAPAWSLEDGIRATIEWFTSHDK